MKWTVIKLRRVHQATISCERHDFRTPTVFLRGTLDEYSEHEQSDCTGIGCNNGNW